MDECLRLSMSLRQGALALDMRFALRAPWTCLFGASGSGKSTILRAIAGVTRPDQGRIAVRGTAGTEQVVFDQKGTICIRADRRPVRLATQQAWLFPGTVRRNLGYGVAAGDGSRAAEIGQRFRLEPLLQADVRDLSGGERQRVSLARAVAAAVYGGEHVGLLLLDEPFAGMYAGLRDELALEIRDWLAGERIPVLSVTHDVGEAFLLGAEVIRVAEGKILAQGPVGEVLAEERMRLRTVLGEEVMQGRPVPAQG